MPDLRQALAARVEEQEADQKAEHARAEAEKNAPKFEELARLDRLSQNDDFRWFVETHLEPIEAREHVAALDINRSKDERDNACHRLAAVREVILAMESRSAKLSNELYPKK